jgi:hypothetical protein
MQAPQNRSGHVTRSEPLSLIYVGRCGITNAKDNTLCHSSVTDGNGMAYAYESCVLIARGGARTGVAHPSSNEAPHSSCFILLIQEKRENYGATD